MLRHSAAHIGLKDAEKRRTPGLGTEARRNGLEGRTGVETCKRAATPPAPKGEWMNRVTRIS